MNTLRHDLEDGVLTVTLDRPHILNAYTVEMADELEATFGEVNERDAALDLVLSADILSAQEALDIGLARSLHEPEDLLGAARALADRWTLGRSQVATALTRQLMYRNSAVADPADAHRVESLGIFYMSRSDAIEGVSAFVDKRAPAFSERAASMPPFYEEWLNGA
jgi:enoyl-CoA hydratase/carnithine racemase